MNKRRVLIVDDDYVNRVVGRDIFELLGCSVETVESGAAALAAVAGGSFDLVCLDRWMPGLSGDEVAAQLPDELFVLAWSTDPSRLPPCFDGVLTKPITLAGAAAALATADAVHRARRVRSRAAPHG